MILVREAGTNHINNTGKVHSKNLNQQFDLADASFWKLRGRVCVLFCFSAYQQEPQSVARRSLEYLTQTWDSCS